VGAKLGEEIENDTPGRTKLARMEHIMMLQTPVEWNKTLLKDSGIGKKKR
jgi:hypothetical protein